MSTQPGSFSVRRSSEIGQSQALFFVAGLWFAIGIIGLFGTVGLFTNTGAHWAYILCGLVLLPNILNHMEMRSRTQVSSFNSYHLIKTMERSSITYFAGWFYLLGWLVVSAMLAELSGELLAGFINVELDLPIIVEPIHVVAALIVLSTIVGLFGYAIPLRFSARVIIIGIVVLLALGAVLAFSGLRSGTTQEIIPDENNRFFQAVLVVIACAWAIGSVGRSQPKASRDASMQFLQLLIPVVLTGLFAFGAFLFDPTTFSVIVLAEALLPGYGQLIAEIVSMIAIVFCWQVISLVMLRQFQTIAIDGVVPSFIVKSQSGISHWLLILQGILTLLVVSIGWVEVLSQLAAVVFLLLESGVAVAAIVVIRKEGPAQKGSFSLPFFPLFPVMAIAINFLISLAVTLWLIPILVGWGLIGALLYFQGGRKRMRLHEVGVTVFQDVSNNPNLYSDFAVVVPIKHDEDDQGLLRLGAILAREKEGHVSVLQVIEVPEQQPLELMAEVAEGSLSGLQPDIGFVEGLGAPAEGIARLSHSVAQSILDTSNEEEAKLLVMGWAKEGDEDRVQRGLLEEVLDGTTADVLMLNRPVPERIRDILIPITGGPHSLRSAELGMAITRQTKGSVTLLSVVDDAEGERAIVQAERRMDNLVERLQEELHEEREGLLQSVKQSMQTRRIGTKIIASDRTPEEVIAQESQRYDLVMMGATELGLLEQHAISSFARTVDSLTDTPIILTRAVTSFGAVLARRIFYSVANVLPTLTRLERDDLFERMQGGGNPSINFFVLIALSSTIATLGLIVDNPATVLGAMLVAPLMSPIISVAAGITYSNIPMLRTAITATVQGALSAVFVGTLIALIVPGDHLTGEVLIRIRPTLFDLLVAVLSGIAGSYAIARKEVGQALPGVSLALALVPPLSTVGVGLATRNPQVSIGAGLLFITNFVAIVFAASMVFLLLGVRPPRREQDQRQLYQSLIAAITALVLLSVPLGLVLYQTLQRNQFETRAQELIVEGIQEWDSKARLTDYDAQFENQTMLRQVMLIQGTVFIPEAAEEYSIIELEQELQQDLRPEVQLELFVLPGTIVESGISPSDTR